MLKWSTKTIQIRELKEYEHNPRKISKKDFERLVRDIKQDGYHGRILVNQDNTIIGGHSRKRALLAAGYTGFDNIEVLCPDRLLTEQELKRINIKDNLSFGEFDFDILGNCFEMTDLLEWGFDKDWLPNMNASDAEESLEKQEKDKCIYCGK